MPPDIPAESAAANASNWRTPPFNHWAFHNVQAVVGAAIIEHAPGNVAALSEAPRSLDQFSLRLPGASPMDLDGFLKATATDALVILRDGRVVFETYGHGTTAHTPHILMSVSKAVTGLIAGILSATGELDVDDLVSNYLPEIGQGAYRGASVRHLLDMRTGVSLDPGQAKDYDATVNSQAEAPGFHQLLATLTTSNGGHGSPFRYISANTDLLGWVIERATGQAFTTLASERLWKPMGAEHEALIVVDHLGAPWCSGGFCMTARDFARVGDLVLNQGRRGGQAVIPEGWLDDLRENGDRDAWRTGEWGQIFAGISPNMSYRSGWYSIHDGPPVLFAMGVHGQNLFIDRVNRLVIAKFSSQGARIDPRAIALTHLAVPEFTRVLTETA